MSYTSPLRWRGAQRIWRLPDSVDAAVRADLDTRAGAA